LKAKSHDPMLAENKSWLLVVPRTMAVGPSIAFMKRVLTAIG
jgi:hypothetical protein